MQGIQKHFFMLKGIVRKKQRLLFLVSVLLFSALLMSASIYLKGEQPHDRFRNGFETEFEGIIFSGELLFKFRQVGEGVNLEIDPYTASSSTLWSAEFVNATITSEILDLYLAELESTVSITINDWNLQENPIDFSVSTFFVVKTEGRERSRLYEFQFLAGKAVTIIPSFLGSIGFLTATISIIGLLTWFFRLKPGSDTFQEVELNTVQQDLVCGECGLSTPSGMRYCTHCGSQLLQQCVSPSCDYKFPVQARFCPICGTPTEPETWLLPGMEEPRLLARFAKAVLVISFSGFLALMILNTVLLVPAYMLIFSNFNLLSRFVFAIFIPIPLIIIEFEGFSLLLYVLAVFIAVFYLISSAIYRDFKQLSSSVLEKRDNLENIGKKIYHLNDNGLVLLFKLYTISFALQITITVLYMISGIDVTSPVTLPSRDNGGDLETTLGELLPSWSSYPSRFIGLIFGLINAAIYEEIIVRILFIGLPLFLLGLLKNVKYDKGKIDLKNIIGLNLASERPVNRIEWLLIALSSIIFGAAHLISWDLWKFFPATVVGIFLGYIFVKKGFAHAVILHAAYDYMAFGLLLQFIDVNVLLGTSDPISLFLAMSVPIVLLSLLASFFISGYVHMINWLREINKSADTGQEKDFVE